MLRKPSYFIPYVPSDGINGFSFWIEQEILFCPPNPCESNFQKFDTHILKRYIQLFRVKIGGIDY